MLYAGLVSAFCFVLIGPGKGCRTFESIQCGQENVENDLRFTVDERIGDRQIIEPFELTVKSR